MAYDEVLAARIRDELTPVPDVTEKKMFGGLAFLVAGNMAVGVIGDELCVRTGTDDFETLLEEPGTRIFDFSGRPMRGWLMVGGPGLEEGPLAGWVERGLAFVRSLSPK